MPGILGDKLRDTHFINQQSTVSHPSLTMEPRDYDHIDNLIH